MGFEYNKLRGRIVEKYGTQAKFAQELGISPTAMSAPMSRGVFMIPRAMGFTPRM